MENRKNDAYYLKRIANDLAFINEHMMNVTEFEFGQNPVLQDSMMFRLIQVSENAQRLTDRFRHEHSVIPWHDVFGLRNRIVHDYGAVDFHIIYTTLTRDIPALLEEMTDGTP